MYLNQLGMSDTFIAINIGVFLFNLILFLQAKKVVTFLNHGEENKNKTLWFKGANILFMFLHLMDVFVEYNTIFEIKEYASKIVDIGYSIIIMYIGVLSYDILSYLNQRKFGLKKELNKKTTYESNYNTRVNNIFIFTFTSAIILIFILQLWHLESLLEQRGVIGIILATLVFTSAHWLPDIISGLSLMNSNRISKGDVIRMNHRFYTVFDMGLKYTRLLDVESNKRVLFENSKFSSSKLSNLSRKASLDGYRDSLYFNIGYTPEEITTEEGYDKHENKIKKIFKDSFAKVEDNKDIKVDFDSGYELFMIESGDYAKKYKFSFYYDDFKKSLPTGAIRKILSAKHLLNEEIQKNAHLAGIDLSTPMLIERNLPEKD